MRNRRIGLVLIVLALIAVSTRHPTADIRLVTHDAADPAPRRMQAAVDLGAMGVSVLVTWTARQLR
jgi:hypothetical protein